VLSREPTSDQPDAEPEKRKGSQSWKGSVNNIKVKAVFSYIAGTDNLALRDPQKIGEGKDLGADVDDCMWRLAFSSGVSNSHGRVVTNKGNGITRGAEGNTLDPAYRNHRLAVGSC
jgi:hypothetical protein